MDGRDFGGRTALHYAALHDDSSLVEWLLSHRADVTLQDGQGQTPLHLALKEKHKRIAQILLQQPQVRVDVLDQFSRLPLHWAAQASDNRTQTQPLHTSRTTQHTHSAHALMAACPCHVLDVCSGYDDLLPLCLSGGGVDVNSATQGGDTPLHWAVSERHVAVVRLLLLHNADVTIANQRGDTAASLAKSAGGDIELLVAERAEQQRSEQQQRQRQSEAGVPMSTFAVSSAAAADSGGAPKKKMTIKLKPKK